MDRSAQEIWNEYQEGQRVLLADGHFARFEECHRMAEGDQWQGLIAGDERPAQLNVLAPMMKNAVSLVGQHSMVIHYAPLNHGPSRTLMQEVCDTLGRLGEREWERLKMDACAWRILEDAYIGGDAFAYFYHRDGEIAMETIDTNRILLADEHNPDIQAQPYVLIVQRRYLEEVREEARKNGVSEEDCAAILPDRDPEGEEREHGRKDKVTCLLRLWKEEGEVHFCRSTRQVMLTPPTGIKGLGLYPIAQYTWKRRKGRARGWGDIWDKIPNQLSINKNLYRFECAVKSSAFPHKVYNASALSEQEVKKLSYPDSAIAVRDFAGQDVNRLIGYLQPAGISGYARSIWQDLIALTRQLGGAGDNLENVDPEKASGAAISAAREAQMLNVNAQMAAYRQFVEEVAAIWYSLWVAYHPGGMEVYLADEMGREERLSVPPEALRRLRVEVRIDVSARNPYSRLSQESSLQGLFERGAITFEEYVDALPESASVPKAVLSRIIQRRRRKGVEKDVLS